MKPFVNSFVRCITASLAIGVAGTAFAQNDKCGVTMAFNFDPGTTVVAGDLVTMTQVVTTTTLGSGNLACGLSVGDPVNAGNALIQAATLAGAPTACPQPGNSNRCTAGGAPAGSACTVNTDCDGGILGSGVCTAVAFTQVAHENPSDGLLSYAFDTTGFGGSVVGFEAQYTGGQTFENAGQICTDVTIAEPCVATISIDRVEGPGAPAAGGSYEWAFRVKVHACVDLKNVSAQGGTNGWAQLIGRSADSLHPTLGTAAIRKANRKTDVILWTIGNMAKGTDAYLTVDLSGSIPRKTADCQIRYLSGAWSALYSEDGIVTEKSDYTGRVTVQVDSDGNPDNCPI
jgi:hypothetical protein